MFSLNNRKKLALAITVYCSLILLVIIIAQFDTVSAILNSIFSAFSPIIIGFSVAYLLNPILKFFERRVLKKIKNKLALRILSLTLTYISLIIFLVGFAWLTIPRLYQSIQDLVSKADIYEATTIDIVNSIIARLSDNEAVAKQIDAGAILGFISEKFADGEEIVKLVLNYITTNYKIILTIPLNILIGLFISVYVLGTKERLGAQFKKLSAAILSNNANASLSARLSKTHATFGEYFTGVVLDAIFIGCASFLIMIVLGIPYASLIAVLLAITNVIPIFGPFLGTIPSAFLIFIADPSKVLPFVIAVIVLQQIDGNIIAPRILGGSTGLSSLGVIVAITIMGSVFGFVGMFVGVPVFAVIVSMIRELIDEELNKKGLSTKTTDYYHKSSIFIPSEKEKQTLWDSIFKKLKVIFSKLFKSKKDKNK